jgi:hypothetical protein
MPVTPFHFGIGALAKGAAPARVSLTAFVASQVVGGLTHPLLDGIMHSDIAPLRPFVDHNPLLGIMGLGALHLVCVVAGLVGITLMALRRTDGHGHDDGHGHGQKEPA